MAGRFWFGVAVSAALGMALCVVEFKPGPKIRRGGGGGAVWTRDAGPDLPRAEWLAEAKSFPAPAAGQEAPFLRLRPPVATPSPATPVTPTPQPPTPEQTVAVPAIPTIPVLPALPVPPVPPASPAAEAAPAPRVPLQPFTRNRRKGGPAPMLPLRRMLMERSGATSSERGGSGGRRPFATAATSRAASGAALANLADVREIDPTWDYYDLPEKGLDVWAGGQGFAAKQELRDAGQSAYELDGREYSLGLRKDWSIDSVIGVSIDILDAKLASSAMLDYRENDLAGYRINAHYEGVAFDYLAFAMRAFYGRLDSEGGGYLQVHHQGDSWREEWREDRHGSEMYGFAGKAGLPLLWGPDIKVLPEIGVNLTKLRTDAYAYSLSSTTHGERPFQVARTDSTSLEIPVAVTFRKDMLHSWGVLTPLLGLAYTVELDDGATGVRTGHAAAASAAQFDPATGEVTGMAADVSPKAFVRVDLGLELRTVGGWRMDARYAHIFAEKYTNDVFKLELGRCF